MASDDLEVVGMPAQGPDLASLLQAVILLHRGELTQAAIAKRLHISRRTFVNWQQYPEFKGLAQAVAAYYQRRMREQRDEVNASVRAHVASELARFEVDITMDFVRAAGASFGDLPPADS